jgi:hypothetical protein
MVSLTLDNEEQTQLDLTGVTSFKVIGHPGSLSWTVVAQFPGATPDLELITYEKWKAAHFAHQSLMRHVIVSGVSVKVHDVSGSIVPV